MAERRTVNPYVAGSSPASGAKLKWIKIMKKFDFERHNLEKDKKRMKDYNDPEYAKGMRRLFEDIKPPERGRRKF